MLPFVMHGYRTSVLSLKGENLSSLNNNENGGGLSPSITTTTTVDSLNTHSSLKQKYRK